MSEEKICAGCGIEYQLEKGQASWRKYCSRACQIKSYNAKRYVGNAPEILLSRKKLGKMDQEC